MDRPDTRQIWNASAATWTELARAGLDVYRDLVNTPAFLRLLPPVAGLTCLDVGSGEGSNTRLLARRGARVVALDVSEVFLAAAAARGGAAGWVQGDGAVLPFRAGSFDAVTAFMSLMDVAAPEQALAEIARVLRPGGFVQFSVTHPATSTPARRWLRDESGAKQVLAMGGYFTEGPMSQTWTFAGAPAGTRPFELTFARRTLAGWLGAVLAAGLVIEAVAEPHADAATAAAHPDVADSAIVPYFLLIRARR